MLPSPVSLAVDEFARHAEAVAPGRIAAVYLVGGLALGDFSARQSNVDLVVVADPPLDAEQLGRLKKGERVLERAGRRPSVWYTGWEDIAEGPVWDRSGPELATPLTRALLREDAVAVLGPDWPVVAYDDGAFRAWCERSLKGAMEQSRGLMVMRREVAPLVLQAARLAHGAVTGRVLSKSEAGEAGGALVPPHFRRILTDAVGYRQGASTSMYWGPFERKYDARELIRQLALAVRR